MVIRRFSTSWWPWRPASGSISPESRCTRIGLVGESLREAIGARLSGSGPVLWIVDDIPTGLSIAELQQWFAPGNLSDARTVLTTRSEEYDAVASDLLLSRLADDEGLSLLTRGRLPSNPDEEVAARDPTW